MPRPPRHLPMHPARFPRLPASQLPFFPQVFRVFPPRGTWCTVIVTATAQTPP